MSQMAIDFDAPPLAVAVEMGRIGMQRAEEHAQAESPGFSELALEMLRHYAETRADPFTSEEVTEWASSAGVNPPDRRAWGGVFLRAARLGVIRRSTQTYRRRLGHGSLGVMWERARQ